MTFENKNLRCNHCRFWWPTAEGAGNEPTANARSSGSAGATRAVADLADLPDHGRHYPSWATSKRDDWCGDHQHTQQ